MPDTSHTINKVVLEVHLPSKKQAPDIQKESAVFLKEKLIPLIDKVATRLNIKDNEVLRIDKLAFDLKGFDANGDNTAVLLQFEQHLEEQLQQLLGKTSAKGIKKTTQAHSNEELFFYLLKEGHLPWWASTSEPIQLQQLAEKILQQPGSFIQQRLPELFRVTQARRRIAFNLAPQTVEKIIRLVYPEATTLIRLMDLITGSVQQQASATLISTTGTSPTKATLYELLFSLHTTADVTTTFIQALFTQQAFTPLVTTLKETILKQPDQYHELGTILQAFSASSPQANIELQAILKLIESAKGGKKIHSPAEKKAGDIGESTTDPATPNKIKPNETTAQKQNSTKLAKPSAGSAQKKTAAQQHTNNESLKQNAPAQTPDASEFDVYTTLSEDTDNYYITNAGIIILTPYLPMFYKALGLSDGKIFHSPQAAERGACLLHYLSYGQTQDFEEHDMVLNKLLCSMNISDAITTNVVISDHEKEESHNLLQAVANNWTALKGTSGEGMRDAFVRRDGLLEPQANGWNLKIEKITLDVLLDKLPWSISIIKLPWSEGLIFVDWS